MSYSAKLMNIMSVYNAALLREVERDIGALPTSMLHDINSDMIMIIISFYQMTQSTSDLLNILQYLLTENETCIEDSRKQCSRVRQLVDNVQETIQKLHDEVPHKCIKFYMIVVG